MNYLLDTNACIALINGKPAPVRTRFAKAVDSGSEVCISSIVSFELWYGVYRGSQPDSNRRRLQTFLSGPIGWLAFEDEDAESAGSIRATLEGSGKSIGAYDLLIAGQALHRQMTLVTANISEFSRVPGLAWQDWAKPSA